MHATPVVLHPSSSAPNAAFATLVRDVRACSACPRMAHSHVLSGANGPLDVRAIFVAEAVGRRGGAITGVPLTRDESGKRFTAFLALAGLHRDDVFLTNAVLCNPLDAAGRNRSPTPAEVGRCRPYLARTLAIVRAPVVVTLGRVALESLRAIAPHAADLPRDVATGVPWNDRTLVPMYHPGRQSTLHRPHPRQEEDWRRLASLFIAGPDLEPNPLSTRIRRARPTPGANLSRTRDSARRVVPT